MNNDNFNDDLHYSQVDEKKSTKNIYIVNLDRLRIILLIGIFTLFMGSSLLLGFIIGKSYVETPLIADNDAVQLDEPVEKNLNNIDKELEVDSNVSDVIYTKSEPPAVYGIRENVKTEVIDGNKKFNDKYYKILQEPDEITISKSKSKSLKKEQEKHIIVASKKPPKPTVNQRSSSLKIRELRDINSEDSNLTESHPFAIQIGSFSDSKNAGKIANILKNRSLPVYINKKMINSREHYRVRIGPARSKAELYRAIESLKSIISVKNAVIVKFTS